MSKKLTKNKTAKGLISLLTIIILMSSILATTIYYQNNITANVIRETSYKDESIKPQIKYVDDINELNQLNEGGYSVRNGFVYYLDTFDSYVPTFLLRKNVDEKISLLRKLEIASQFPLYIKVKDKEQENVLFVVDSGGAIIYSNTFEGLAKKESIEKKSVANSITGKVTGMERVSGF